YNGLHLHMYSHIAEYNQHGFYHSWFDGMYQQLKWLSYAAKGGPFRCVGDPSYTWSDVEIAFTAWIHSSGLVEQYETRCACDTEQRERALLKTLQEKYAKK